MALAYLRILFFKIIEFLCIVIPEENNDYVPLTAPPISHFELFWRLVKYVHLHYKKIIFSYILMFIQTPLEFAQPYYYSAVIAQALHHHGNYDHDKQMHDIGMLILLKAINYILAEVKSRYADDYKEVISDEIKIDLFKAVVNGDIADFDEYGSFKMSCIVNQADALVPFVVNDIPKFVETLIRFPGSIILMFSLSTELAIVSIASIPIFSLIIILSRKVDDRRWEDRDSDFSLSSYIYEVFDTIKTVRSFGCQREETRKVRDFMAEERKQNVKMGLVQNIILFLLDSVNGAFDFVVIIYGGMLIRADRMSAESFLSYQSYHSTFENSMAEIRYQIRNGITVLMDSRKAFAYVDKEHKVKRDGVLRPPIKGEIKMEDISFAYQSRTNQNVIKGFSLHINEGDSVALVGPSGVGKSTIISLLERFYAPDSGTITVDGIPVEEIDDEYYHKQVALVPQEPFLYNRSIKENILYGCDWATEEQMIEAAKMANIHDFVMTLEKGYETKCGNFGSQMSGGQKQRIAIARALVRDPAILLLDEATSALDTETECVVQEALERCRKNRTVIIIAHRLSTIRNVDKIVVMKEGHVAEHGTHKELMKIKDGIYEKLVKLQVKGFALDSIEDAFDEVENMEANAKVPETANMEISEFAERLKITNGD